MKNLSYLLFGIVFCLIACVKEEIVLSPPTADKINFSALAVGQTTQYIEYSTTCEDVHGDLVYTGDTLVVSVIQEDNGLLLEEKFTIYSPSYLNGITESVTYPISNKNNIVEIPTRFNSRLFNFYGSDSLHLNPTKRTPLQQENCRINIGRNTFTGNEIGILSNFQIGEIVMKDKTAVSCVPVIDVDGYLLYDTYQLHMSHIVTSSSFGGDTNYFVNGWCIIE